MESHEVLKRAINKTGAKAVAADMKLSTSLIYKWCQPSDSLDASGADNPLDRIARIYESTGDVEPIQWLCRQADGFFVRNPESARKDAAPLLQVTQRILQEFSDLLDVVSKSIADDQCVEAGEARKIRREWEQLKSVTEAFVVACESGAYDVDNGSDHE